MLTPDRRELLLKHLRDVGSVRIVELVELLGVSDVTVRRDIDALVSLGLAERFHGGVTVPREYSGEQAGSARAAVPEVKPLRLGVLLPDIGYFRAYHREVLAGIAEASERANAKQCLMISKYDQERDLAAVRSFVRDGIDGLLLAPLNHPGTRFSYLAEELRALTVPTVLLERQLDPTILIDRIDHVMSDHDAGARMAVEHLAGLGHRRIALVTKDSGPTAPSVCAGYCYAVKALKLDTDLPLLKVPQLGDNENLADQRLEEAFEALRDLRATAVLIHGDEEAVALEQLALEAGLRVPKDLAIVCYDDTVAEFASIPLTAVAPPKRVIGWTGVDILLRRIRMGEAWPVQHISVQPTLVVRDSCGAAKRRRRTPEAR